ncbi:MAG: hypothetical protein L0H64_08745 [Pseudonocardia sp.]|nr:hypothetical protein [Pseudonocardia sp.]
MATPADVREAATVAITDQALRRELCTPEGLARALTRAARRPGAPRALDQAKQLNGCPPL